MKKLERSHKYRRLKFVSLREIVVAFLRETHRVMSSPLQTYTITQGEEKFSYDSIDDVALLFDRTDVTHQFVNLDGADGSSLLVSYSPLTFQYTISGTPELIHRFSSKLESALSDPQSLTDYPIIFIGHGRRPDWKDLRDHLRDEQKFELEYYESDNRAGGGIRNILQKMRARSGCAVLVYTAEDELTDGRKQARPNVIHECGFFSAGLAEGRTIVLAEAGVYIPSNQAGEQYIEFPSASIQTCFGALVAAIRRLTPRV